MILGTERHRAASRSRYRLQPQPESPVAESRAQHPHRESRRHGSGERHRHQLRGHGGRGPLFRHRDPARCWPEPWMPEGRRPGVSHEWAHQRCCDLRLRVCADLPCLVAECNGHGGDSGGRPSFFTFTWPVGAPVGTYTFGMVATPPGAFADGTVNPSDLLTVGVDSLSVSPGAGLVSAPCSLGSGSWSARPRLALPLP